MESFLSYNEYNKIDFSCSKNKIEKEIFRVDKNHIITKDGYLKGLLDFLGNILIEPKYNMIDKFINDRAVVTLNKKQGLIDDKGNEVVPAIYDSIKYLNNGLYKVTKDGYCGLIDLNNNKIMNINYQDIWVSEDNTITFKKNNILGIYDKEEIFLNKKYNLLGGFKDGIAIVGRVRKINDKYPLLHNQTFEIPDYYNGLEVGLIDKKGNIILKCNYRAISIIDSNCVIALTSNGWYYINHKNNSMCKLDLDVGFIKDFKDGIAIAGYINNQVLINKEGVVLTKNWHKEIDNFKDEIAIVRKEPFGYGAINKSGNEFISGSSLIRYMRVNNDKTVSVLGISNVWNLYDAEGSNLIKDMKGDMNDNVYVDSLLIHKENYKYTLFNKEGTKLIPEFSCKNVYIINKDTIIIDNSIIDLKDLKIDYCIDINYGNKTYTKIFNLRKKRDIYINKLFKYIEEVIDDKINKDEIKIKEKNNRV